MTDQVQDGLPDGAGRAFDIPRLRVEIPPQIHVLPKNRPEHTHPQIGVKSHGIRTLGLLIQTPDFEEPAKQRSRQLDVINAAAGMFIKFPTMGLQIGASGRRRNPSLKSSEQQTNLGKPAKNAVEMPARKQKPLQIVRSLRL